MPIKILYLYSQIYYRGLAYKLCTSKLRKKGNARLLWATSMIAAEHKAGSSSFKINHPNLQMSAATNIMIAAEPKAD
jgi:hypothetical protein